MGLLQIMHHDPEARNNLAATERLIHIQLHGFIAIKYQKHVANAGPQIIINPQ